MDKDAIQEGCCTARCRGKGHRHRVCPINGEKGQRVAASTLRHLVKETKRSGIKGAGYYFCRASDCDTVYYHPESGQCFDKADLDIRVGLKETEDPIWLCYCFDISKKMIDEALEATGRSSFEALIRREVALGNCACEVKNPSGRCCLGDVRAAEKAARNALARPSDLTLK